MTPPSKASFPTKAVPLAQHPAKLPKAEISDDVDHARIASAGVEKLGRLSSQDLADEAIWRDSYALTGTLRTFFSPRLLIAAWEELTTKHQPAEFDIVEGSSRIVRLGPHGCWVEANFTFNLQGSRRSRCSGVIGLTSAPDAEGGWRIWLLTTILEQIEGFPDVDRLAPVDDANVTSPASSSFLDAQYDCVVVGASIAGLCMAARLQALGVNYLLIERTSALGDNWAVGRYDSLKLHTSKYFNQMPYDPPIFDEQDPYHLSMPALVAGFRRFVQTFGIHVVTSTELQSGRYDPDERCWNMQVRHKADVQSLRARHCVLATGNNGYTPSFPQYPGQEKYQGDVMHGGQWQNAQPWKDQGKHGVCVGTGNTAHGVIGDMAQAGFASVTMVQRSRTFLLPDSTFAALVDPVYNEKTATATSDRMLLGYPLPVSRLMGKAGIQMCAEANSGYFDEMEARGWDIERNGDLWGMLYDHEGGHFFDISAGKYIADGTVKVKCDALPISYSETGLIMSDGTHLRADVIVLATGFKGSIKDSAKTFFGGEVVDSLEDFWQCDAEGESRGAWKDVGHPGLWYTGHGFAHARYYSRFVAMHIKADVEGRPIETYTVAPGI